MSAVLLLAVGREIRHARYRHPIKAAAATRRECPRDRAHGGGDCYSDGGNGKNVEAVGPNGLPGELLKPGLRQDRSILLELHRLFALI